MTFHPSAARPLPSAVDPREHEWTVSRQPGSVPQALPGHPSPEAERRLDLLLDLSRGFLDVDEEDS